jgi:hypothetical protein
MSILQKFNRQGTLLDGSMNGGRPSAALKDPATLPINNTFRNGEYDTALPDGVETSRASDITGN